MNGPIQSHDRWTRPQVAALAVVCALGAAIVVWKLGGTDSGFGAVVAGILGFIGGGWIGTRLFPGYDDDEDG
ncbi:hypothetical protein ACIREE_15375 [Streptomyces sp. NPDC102467]|uniref:hypothetical protein n=1 Tax=Streptomyces sp. NPDC102467 TaxID=3366179 RepID=UPI0038249476